MKNIKLFLLIIFLSLPVDCFAGSDIGRLREEALQGDVEAQYALALYFDGKQEYTKALNGT